MLRGDLKAARATFQAALRLDPNNQNHAQQHQAAELEPEFYRTLSERRAMREH